MFKTLFILTLLLVTSSFAQHKHDHAPYAGLQKREIKALSDEQIKDLKSGKGMSLALAAELNGYPGPAHVLELADKINLTSKQKQQTQDLFKAMSKETKALGTQLIKEEKALDLLFKIIFFLVFTFSIFLQKFFAFFFFNYLILTSHTY